MWNKEVELPFRYVRGKDDQPVVAPGLVEYLREKRGVLSYPFPATIFR